MPLVSKNLNHWTLKDNQVILSDDYRKQGLDKNNKWHKFKKITGTRFSSIAGLSKYNTSFKTWMEMVSLFKSDMDQTLADAGNIIEGKLRIYAESVLHQKYTYHDPSSCGWDLFHDNEIFGGIIDGEPIDENSNIDYSNGKMMLEMKTSSIDKLAYFPDVNGNLMMKKNENNIPLIAKDGEGKKRLEWFDENNNIKVPYEYQFQLSLYLKLRNVKKGMFIITFLTPNDYANPAKFDPSTHEVRFVEFEIKDQDKFDAIYENAALWYKNHILTGISPVMTSEDKKWLDTELKRIKVEK